MASDANQTIASQVPFHDFATFCEKACKIQGKDKKKEMFKKFLAHWRSAHTKMHGPNKTTDSFFPVMRFLLPHLDKDRLSYGMKEVVLAKYYIDVLNISKESDDAKRLLNYKAPTAGKQDAGDFASVAYVVLQNRCPEKGSLTIEDINNSLDVIAQANAEKRRDITKQELQKVIRNTSALEQKWLIRVMLKEMKLGLNENSILPTFHPEALELYNVCNSLLKVCLDLHDPSTKLNETEIILFTPFRPMLGQRAAIDEVEKLMNNTDFIIETKIDGERIQLHKDGDEFRYFSRSSIDYTHVFGTTRYRGTITPYIAPLFKSDITSCILDGEMVGYDNDLKDFVLKGSNIDIKSDNLVGIQPCFVVFDVLMINDTKLANIPLKERIEKCENVFDVCEGRLQHVNRKMRRTKGDVVNAINNAIDQREEGIVVKDPLSLYKPSKRKGSGWLKLKPEYVDSLSDELDLIILGGDYGSGFRRGGVVSHFLLGVAETETIKGGKPTSFQTFGKVGSGYSDKELNSLLTKLNKHWKKFDVTNPPSSIQFTSTFKEKPDVWIEPQNSVIVQIKAAEISTSDKYKCGCTMRFPRLEKIRDDKLWSDCMTSDELHELRKIADGRLTYRLTDGLSSEPAKKKRRMTTRMEKPRTVAQHFKGADITDVQEMSQIFSGKEFCIINGPSNHSKQDLEKKIVEFGGSFVQNPGNNTYCVIADKVNFRTKSIITRGTIDVVNATWLIQCLEKESLLPYRPSDMLHTTLKTLQLFQQDFDKYGDNYTEDTNKEKLAELFSLITDVDEQPVNRQDIAEIEYGYFENDSKLGLFRRTRLLVENNLAESNDCKFVCLEYKFHGGIIDEKLTDEITHVLVNYSTDMVLLRQMICTMRRKPHIVIKKWIEDCLAQNSMVNEGLYEPP